VSGAGERGALTRVARLAPLRAAARWAAGLVAGIEAFALPQRCPGCGAEADPRQLLCDDCRALIPPLSTALCVRCLARGREPVGCIAHPDHVAWAAWVYEERAALLIHALKYHDRPGLARSLAVSLARALPGGEGAATARFDLVAAVPLHRARRRERGYNQAEALAASLADRIGVPALPGAIERWRPTRPQARLGPRERRSNLAGAFRAPRPSWLAGRRVLIVDDVLTTGATLEACGDAVRAAGGHPTAVALAWAQ
jgi:ComF family protein